MRVENSLTRQNNSAYSKNKKKNNSEEKNQQENDSEQYSMSSEVELLNRLLKQPEYEYKPLPFYFNNSSILNAKQAKTISNAIYQIASEQGHQIDINVIDKLVKSNVNSEYLQHSEWINSEIEKQSDKYFSEEEKALFETIYRKFEIQEIKTSILNSIVINYLKQKISNIQNNESLVEFNQSMHETLNNTNEIDADTKTLITKTLDVNAQ